MRGVLLAHAVFRLGAAGPQGLVVRYALLDPDPPRGYLASAGLPMLASSLCLAERHLAPALSAAGHAPPSYVLYTDSGSHGPAAFLLAEYLPGLRARVRLVNLDRDPGDAPRLRPFRSLGLDPVNAASLRRTLADTAHLPSQRGRLLLGLDISFLASPQELVARMGQLNTSQAFYMADQVTFEDTLYTLPAYSGPQCPGLLGDFVYLAPGLHITVEAMQAKARWYSEQPLGPERTMPPTFWLSPPAARGLHGIDQFALNLAVAEAAQPPGPGGCRPLPRERFVHRGGYPRPWAEGLGVEAVHDKVVSSCASGGLHDCGSLAAAGLSHHLVSGLRFEEPLLHVGCLAGKSAAAHRWGPSELAPLAATLCLAEEVLAPAPGSGVPLPAYALYTSDRSCGHASTLLLREFPGLRPRLRILNLARAPNNDPQELSLGVASCAAQVDRSQPLLALEASFLAPAGLVSQVLRGLNRSRGAEAQETLHLLDLVRLHSPQESGALPGAVGVGLVFCFCGRAHGMECPQL